MGNGEDEEAEARRKRLCVYKWKKPFLDLVKEIRPKGWAGLLVETGEGEEGLGLLLGRADDEVS